MAKEEKKTTEKEEEKSRPKTVEKPEIKDKSSIREDKPLKPKSPTESKSSMKEDEASYNPWNLLIYPHLAEKSMNMVEMENKLIFFVKRRSTKKQILEAVEKGFDVKVEKVNIEITRKGTKKAYIKLSPEHEAADIASRLGMI